MTPKEMNDKIKALKDEKIYSQKEMDEAIQRSNNSWLVLLIIMSIISLIITVLVK